jgi:hypothetical protein
MDKLARQWPSRPVRDDSAVQNELRATSRPIRTAAVGAAHAGIQSADRRRSISERSSLTGLAGRPMGQAAQDGTGQAEAPTRRPERDAFKRANEQAAGPGRSRMQMTQAEMEFNLPVARRSGGRLGAGCVVRPIQLCLVRRRRQPATNKELEFARNKPIVAASIWPA